MYRIRPAALTDLASIKQLAVQTNMFTAEEAGFFDALLAGFTDGTLEGHQWVVVPAPSSGLLGAAYMAPEPFADRLWNVYFISVAPSAQGQGVGSALMRHLEQHLVARGEQVARVMVVETSSTEQYARTREFYPTLGYDVEARIRDFYGPQNDKVVFWKSLV